MNVDTNRVFSYSELFGPFKCDICKSEAWMIVVSKEERAGLPEEKYEASTKAINMGMASCNDHVENCFKIIDE